jgi:hypothetical protein
MEDNMSIHLWFVSWVFASVILSASAHAESVELAPNCKKEGGGYVVTGGGEGASKSLASQGALIDARKNALLCIFGGQIEYSSESTETLTDAEHSGRTKVTVNSESIDWSGFSFVEGSDEETDGAWKSAATFTWSFKDVEANKTKIDALTKQKEKNRALASEIEATKKIAEEKQALIERQREEINRLKEQELEIAKMKSENARIVAKISSRKKERDSKEMEWIKMVTKFGCGLTIDDVKDVLGSPDSIDVRGKPLDSTGYRFQPLLYFIYGRYALVAPVPGLNTTKFDDWNYAKKYVSTSQITYVAQYVGGDTAWWICKK